jgi:VWFA-related protein
MTHPLLVTSVILIVGGPVVALSQIPVFTTRVDVVRVDVLVTDGGLPVRDLRASDFEILDNGVAQQVDFASLEQIPLNVILVFDMSQSVVGPRLGHLQSAGGALLDGLKPADQAALITFSHVVALRQRLTGDLGLVRAALGKSSAMGDTALVDAAFAGIVLGESDVGRALLIVFSDGLDTSSWLTADAVLQTARRADVVAYGVSAGTLTTEPFLRDLVRATGGTLYEVESTKNLGGVFLRVLEEFRQRYLLSYTPQGVSRDGWHRLDVRVKGRKATVKARPGYLAGS